MAGARAYDANVAAKPWHPLVLGMILLLGGQGRVPLLGQPGPVEEPVDRTNQFVCRVWHVEDGLPQESVWAILQTRDGYLWIGTGGGLARFDGVRFQVFGLAEGLPSLHVRALLEDRQGALWIGTANGLCRYWAGQFTSWTTRDGLAGDSINGLAKDREGTIWISTAGLSRWQSGKYETMGASAGLAGETVQAVVANRNGVIWIATPKLGLLRWNGARFVPAIGTPETLKLRPRKLLKDRAGRIWASATGRVYCLEGTSLKTYGPEEGLPNTFLTCLHEGLDGTVWAGSLNQGLYYLRGGRFYAVHQADGLSGKAVRAIGEDREGNLWVGTRDSGLNRLRPNVDYAQNLGREDRGVGSLAGGIARWRLVGGDHRSRPLPHPRGKTRAFSQRTAAAEQPAGWYGADGPGWQPVVQFLGNAISVAGWGSAVNFPGQPGALSL